jgi:hypothetical protein
VVFSLFSQGVGTFSFLQESIRDEVNRNTNVLSIILQLKLLLCMNRSLLILNEGKSS